MPIKGELNWQNRVIWKDTVGIIGTSSGIAVRKKKFINGLLKHFIADWFKICTAYQDFNNQY